MEAQVCVVRLLSTFGTLRISWQRADLLEGHTVYPSPCPDYSNPSAFPNPSFPSESLLHFISEDSSLPREGS